ncbi:MAG: anhydro-N-acetylmuramic acid kinase [Porticoccaceae bacterium]|nr:anhydro-N-acetylmuramic acid kinase [Porticoccaceae bacterium]
MTGTSMDGIDAALVEFGGDDKSKQIRVVSTLSHPITETLRTALLDLSLPGRGVAGQDRIDLMGSVDAQLGELLANAVNSLLLKASMASTQITAIGSHGQTIRHRPPGASSEPPLPFTLQIGDPNRIAAHTGISTVADFRRRDIALGGHGAPLVPAFHRAAFRDAEHHRVIVNIGGISNITCLPAQGLVSGPVSGPVSGIVTGFDTGPGNGLLDAWINRHRGLAYDDGGQWAASHIPHPDLLAHLKQHNFFNQPPPKSTGREDFNLDWLDRQLENFVDIDTGSVQATLLALTAESIAEAIAKTSKLATEIYICGGGALNTALMDALKTLLAPAKVASTSALGIDPEWVEAAAFAWLARQTLARLPGSLAEVTGATKAEILGAIYPSAY